MSTETFDYIIVGAGSAGCVLANRLTEDGRSTVLLLERGGSDRSILIRIPAAVSMPTNMPRYDCGYRSESEPNLNGRRLHRRVVGGPSSINSVVYVRAIPWTLKVGRKPAPSAGGGPRCCPIFAAPKPALKEAIPGAAIPTRCAPDTDS